MDVGGGGIAVEEDENRIAVVVRLTCIDVDHLGAEDADFVEDGGEVGRDVCFGRLRCFHGEEC